MVLGDNIFAGHGLKKRLKAAVENAETGKGATVFGYYVDDPERFGVRRHIVGGANRTLFSVDLPSRLCRTGT